MKGVLLALFLLASSAQAQDIPRGLGHPNGPVHWYDKECCNTKDCEVLEPGAIKAEKDGYAVLYMSSRNFIVRAFVPYGSPKIRVSRDGNEHGCAATYVLYCIYLPMAV